LKAITNATVFTATGEALIPNGTVLVDGDKIVAVGSKSEVKVPPGTQEISACGWFVMPGLIDAHQHFGHPDPREYIGRVEEHDREVERHHTAYEWLPVVVRNGRHLLENGVTTMRSMAELDAMDFIYRRFFDSGKLLGPRILVSGRGVVTSFGSALDLCYIANGVDEIRQAVRKCVADGVDWVKLFVSGGMTQGPHKLLMNEGEVGAAVDEAHRAGKKVAAHAIGDRSVRVCADAGVDTIEHATYQITDETVEAVRKNGSACVLSNLWPYEIYVSGVKKGKRSGTREAAVDGTMRLYKAGVKLGLGADCVFVGSPLADEACFLSEFGIPNDKVLSIVTKENAEICGVIDRIGTLEPGKFADVIVVNGNPTENMNVLRRVILTMKGGKIVYDATGRCA